MRTITLVAILLIAFGIVAFAYEGITYTSRRESIHVGSLHVTTEKTHGIPMPPIAGAIAMALGTVLLVVDRKRFVHAAAR